MQRILFLILIIVSTSCKNNPNDKDNERILSASSGTLNNISIVVDNDLWKGAVGETIREHLASPLVGLPQNEPIFTMNQIPPSVFSGFAAKNRTVLKIEKGKLKGVKVLKNLYAKPQKIIVVSGKNVQEIVNELNSNSNKIIEEFNKEEIKEKQRQIAKSINKTDKIEKELGITIDFPTIYRIAKEDNNFFWVRKDITTGTVNFMLYELPLTAINEKEELIPQIIKIRDSVGKVYIHGEIEGAYMITEEAYSPHLFKTTVNGNSAIEIRGTWELKNAFMAGPFVDYLIKDEKNNRYIVAEGFTFAPSVSKRNYMFELDAIIKSIKIK